MTQPPDRLDQVDPNFRQDLLESERAVYVVASHMRHEGFSIELPPIKVRPPGGRIESYSDTIDMVAKKDPINLRIEVKGRDVSFDKPEDFPYPTLILDNAAHYDRIKKLGLEADWYFVLNRALTVALVLEGHDTSNWERKTVNSKTRGRPRPYYYVPVADFKCIRLKGITNA